MTAPVVVGGAATAFEETVAAVAGGGGKVGDAGGLFSADCLMPLVKLIEVGAGAMLLSGRLVPLTLTLLAPIRVNIVGFHARFDPSGMGLGLFLTGLKLFLAWSYRPHFRGVLTIHAQPQPPAPVAETRGAHAKA